MTIAHLFDPAARNPAGTMSMGVESRLYNFKFESAKCKIEQGHFATLTVRETVNRLAEAYGNVGWFDGEKARVVKEELLAIGVRFFT